jgi:acetyltransferase
MNFAISTFSVTEFDEAFPQLAALLEDAVITGAALGFMPASFAADAPAYWQRVRQGIQDGQLLLFVARETASGNVLGGVQLALAGQPNGTHRAEVAKMLVHSRARRQGIGRRLLRALEDKARQLGRTTLVLDTRQGDVAELLYQSVGFQMAGIIPDYAQSGDGTLHATVVYYKLLTA